MKRSVPLLMAATTFLAACTAGSDPGPDPRTETVTAEELLRAVGPALAAGDPLPVPDAPGDGDESFDPAELAAVAGTYRLATGDRFEVTPSDDGRLTVTAQGADAVAALFPLPAGADRDDVRAHEEAVLALLAGETREGQEERAFFEADIGPIDRVDLAGSVVERGEVWTYVTVTSGPEPVLASYALDEQGGVAAAEIDTEPPSLSFLPSGDGRFRPDDPTGTGPAVRLELDGGVLTVAGPSGSTNAQVVG